jgi:4-alpha-glucanotransferase
MKRRAGILLHPTSLPSPFGQGDFGMEAYRFIDWLHQAGQRVWQILPLTIPDHTGSPYSSSSSMAGNWLLVSPDELVRAGLLDKSSLPPTTPVAPVNFRTIFKARAEIITRSLNFFISHGSAELKKEFRVFKNNESSWLDDMALFMACKDYFHYQPWPRWPKNLASRQPGALAGAKKKLKKSTAFYEYGQWLFYRQWRHLKSYANEKGVAIIGDLPFFVCHDSVDVWSHQDMFKLDEHHLPSFVSGVPPDYFSAKGQIWGDPQYDWLFLAQTNFDWWTKRFQQALTLYDCIRLDHFRGYQAVWYIKRGSYTARHGHWEPVPGEKLFHLLKRQLHHLPFIAEDLGLITNEVTVLRQQFNFPGTRVLQFSFDGLPKNTHRPANYDHNVIAYTGTHDNDTARGWISNSGKSGEIQNALKQTGATTRTFTWKLIEKGMYSKADTFIAPLQDVLNLGSGARLNKPGTKHHNWAWRFAKNALTDPLAKKLRQLTSSTGR